MRIRDASVSSNQCVGYDPTVTRVATLRLLLSVVYSTVQEAPAIGLPSIFVLESITNWTEEAWELDCAVAPLELERLSVREVSVTDAIVPLTLCALADAGCDDWLCVAADCAQAGVNISAATNRKPAILIVVFMNSAPQELGWPVPLEHAGCQNELFSRALSNVLKKQHNLPLSALANTDVSSAMREKFSISRR